MDRVAVKLEQDLAPMDEGNSEKQVMSRLKLHWRSVDNMTVPPAPYTEKIGFHRVQRTLVMQ